MKKFGTLSFAALFMFAMVSCSGEKSGDEATGENGETPSGEVATTPSTDPADNIPAEPDMPVTTANFSEESHDFGEIKEGSKVVHEYKFKNTGSNPLKIHNVKPSCGCTTPDWTKEEIAPGAEGFIKVEFDSKGKTGVQKKSVTVTMNTEPKTKILNFSGEVIGEGGAATPQPADH